MAISAPSRLRAALDAGLLGWLTERVSLPEDPPETRLRKTSLVIISLMIVPAGVFWGLMYLLYREPVSAIIPLTYSVFSSGSLIYLMATRRYEDYRFSQLVLILALPALLMASLGGYESASAVIIWSFLCPMGALVFAGRAAARRWMLLYLGSLVLGGVLHPALAAENRLPDSIQIAFYVLNLGAVCTIIFVLLSYFERERDRFYNLLQVEQQKSERLLVNVLPAEIAPLLKEGDTVAERFESASILFADVVAFTEHSRALSPEQMVGLLNEIFSDFDQIVGRYGLEKIRTIGDNYMVASGVPKRRRDHAQALADMALELCQYLKGRHATPAGTVEFRVGMSSGPLVGAVIGQTKFHYDVWGHPVNMASRMESHGLPGRVQLTRDSYELLREEFSCEPRGEIEVKGVGRMETWLLVGRASGRL